MQVLQFIVKAAFKTEPSVSEKMLNIICWNYLLLEHYCWW